MGVSALGRERRADEGTGMLRILGILLAIWLAWIVVTAVLHTVVWLLVIGIVLFLGTSAYTAIKGRQRKHLSR
jgi:cytochrome bd-type quinol oxidase subunit 1